ncbi:hypothetical protein [Sulfurovum sp.]|uniref:hypothetical protein n=1 Tax=Sulfurovum sp. TaxID=1969726 RepID=UPI002867EC4A|nr:hypothetical protein [Sulfurovum sp.]
MSMLPAKKSKPAFVSHYLVLRDLIDGVDVRQYSDSVVYLTSRIENIKNYLVKCGLRFDDDAVAYSRYSYYKPYVLMQDQENIELAKSILESFKTEKVMQFLPDASQVRND